MHCRLKNNRNNKQIQKKHNRQLKQKERRFYKNLYKSNAKYFSLYKRHRNSKKSISQNKRRVSSNKKRESFEFNGHVVLLPAFIDFYKDRNRNSTIRTLLDIYSCKRKKILIDFHDVTTMSAAATAMLFSTIRHIKLNCNIEVKIKLPRSKKSQAILKQIKLFDFIEIPSTIDVDKYKNVKCWYTEHGYELLTPEYISKIISGIIENCKINQHIDIERYRKKIDLTVSETILNTAQKYAVYCQNFRSKIQKIQKIQKNSFKNNFLNKLVL